MSSQICPEDLDMALVSRNILGIALVSRKILVGKLYQIEHTVQSGSYMDENEDETKRTGVVDSSYEMS